MRHPLHPQDKPVFKNRDEVEFILDGDVAGKIYTGRIACRSINNVIDHWVIILDEKVEGYDWDAVTIPHTFIRRKGGNDTFPCEWLRSA
jgi:hypothetical protein